MGGISTVLGYELYGRWRYSSFVSKQNGRDDLKTFRLSDGRRLSYRESGDSGGRPAFYFHGAAGSSVEWSFDPKTLRRTRTGGRRDQDNIAAVSNAEELFRTIPNVVVHRVAGEGHFLIYNHEQELISSVSK